VDEEILESVAVEIDDVLRVVRSRSAVRPEREARRIDLARVEVLRAEEAVPCSSATRMTRCG
jgi:hypothetical protein